MEVNDDSRIYVDGGLPATLNDGAGAQTDCMTEPARRQTAARCKRPFWHGLRILEPGCLRILEPGCLSSKARVDNASGLRNDFLAATLL
jgi:hypothetical protein